MPLVTCRLIVFTWCVFEELSVERSQGSFLSVAMKTDEALLAIVKVVAGENRRNCTYDVTVCCRVVKHVADWNGQEVQVFRNGESKLAW